MTTTKWIDRVTKDDDNREFVMSTCGARLQTKTRGSEGRLVRGDAAGGKENIFAYVAGVSKKRQEHGQDEVKLIFIDVQKAHFNTKCDEQEWVELPDEFKKSRKVIWNEKAVSGWEDDNARRLVDDGFQRGNSIIPRLHVRVVVHGDDFTFAATKV